MSSKNIVITGASKGIGKAITLYFAERGFNVAVCARNEKALAELEKELSSFNIKVIAEICDVSDKNAVKTFAQKVLNEWKNIDVLVNNAGSYLPGRVIDEDDNNLDFLIKTNLYSAYNVTRAFVHSMIEKKQGHIFNISSIAGLQAYPNGGSYSISKFAMIGLSKALREELKPHNIRVTNLAPGATLTDSWAGTDLPESRFISPNDLAKLIFDINSLSASADVEEVIIRPILGDI